jgi:transcriptional regulator with XRE-family HTH domain
MNLQNQLKLYLEIEDLTAAQLSKKSGVSKQVLSLWLKGASPKNVEQVKSVAEILKTTVDNLCFGSGKEPKKKSDFDSISDDEWLSGAFEIKIRRIKK